MKRSLKLRLLVATSLSSAVVLASLGVAIYATMSHRLLSDYDASLMAKARMLAATAEQRRGTVRFEFDSRQMPEFSAAKNPEFFEMWLDDGQVLCRSDSLRGSDLPSSDASARATVGSIDPPGTSPGRAVYLRFTPGLDEDQERPGRPDGLRACTIAVAGTPVEAERTLRSLGWLLIVACGAAIVLSGALLLRVVSRSVAPVTELAREIDALRETDLVGRLRPDGVPQELSPIVEKLNGLLARLESAFLRERAFTADVAHELRTPLAGLLSTLEVCRSRPRDRQAYEAALDECRGMTDRMQAMIENLLLLARADAGQLPIARRRVDAAWLLKECWSLFQNRADSRRLKLEWDVADPCEGETDPEKLRIVLQNLFDNAVSYADDGGSLRVVARAQRDALEIVVANSGSRVSSQDAPHLFERFWRGDRARPETGIHCGLGLSLSQRLITLLEGRVAIETTPGGEFVVRLLVPFASSAVAPQREPESWPTRAAS